MTESKKHETAKPANEPAVQTGNELTDADLNKASGGALNAYKPGTDATHSSGGGGGAGAPAMGDGSVRTNNTLIGLL
jgi:hypothetical protein